LKDGKIVEHWAVQDGLALMIQQGVFSPPGA
jgi:predicted ester cyclase